MPVPPLAVGRIPVTPVVKGNPVALVRTPDAGVPRAGVCSVGDANVPPVTVLPVKVRAVGRLSTTAPDPALAVISLAVPAMDATPPVCLVSPFELSTFQRPFDHHKVSPTASADLTSIRVAGPTVSAKRTVTVA